METTVKTGIGRDEWYPMYNFEEGTEFEVPKALVRKAERVMKAFYELQKELHKIYTNEP